MQSFKRLVHRGASSAGHGIARNRLTPAPEKARFLHPLYQYPAQRTSARFLDFYELTNKTAIEKERARLKDEMSRGYFDDMKELKEHGGKIAAASKVLIPAAVAVKFPVLEASYPDGTTIKLPVGSETNNPDVKSGSAAKASLVCLSFRANSQAMISSWSQPFLDAFGGSDQLQIYESLLLRRMKKSNPEDRDGPLMKQLVYSFGDNYYLRKELKILNLLTGYAFLLDKFGRIRWQGFGSSTPEEVSSLLSCTSLLLGEK